MKDKEKNYEKCDKCFEGMCDIELGFHCGEYLLKEKNQIPTKNKMKKTKTKMEREIRINKVFSVNADNFEDACIEVEENLARENMEFSRECWESAELIEIKE